MEEFRIGAGALRPLTVSHEGGARNVVNPVASRTRSRAFPLGRDRADRAVSVRSEGNDRWIYLVKRRRSPFGSLA